MKSAAAVGGVAALPVGVALAAAEAAEAAISVELWVALFLLTEAAAAGGRVVAAAASAALSAMAAATAEAAAAAAFFAFFFLPASLMDAMVDGCFGE